MYGKGHVALNKVNVRMVISRAVDLDAGLHSLNSMLKDFNYL